jgi:Ala-tRNA(Pro) deacylase
MSEQYKVFDYLLDLLANEKARFRVIEHAPEGRSDEVARIRGTTPEQGAKAMLCILPEMADSILLLAVLPGNMKIDMRQAGAVFGGKKAQLAPSELAQRKTDCVMGAVPPFSLSPNILLVVDPSLLVHAEIAFNAGRLDRSVVLNTADYIRIAKPRIVDITQKVTMT